MGGVRSAPGCGAQCRWAKELNEGAGPPAVGGPRGYGEAESGVQIMALFLAAHWHNGWAVIEIKGVLDAATARELRDFATSVHAQHRYQHLILDLSELTHADADGLNALMSVKALLDQGQGELRLVCPQGRMERLLHSSGAASALTVYPSLDAVLSTPRTVPVHRMGGAVQ